MLTGIFGGVLIRGIFAILRFRQHSLDSPIGYIPVTVPLNYLTTYDFLSQTAKRRWTQYLLFKTIPVAISFVLVAGIDQTIEPNQWILRILSFSILMITYYSPDLFLAIKDRLEPDYTSVILLKVLLFILNLIIAVIVFGISFFVDFTNVIPSFDGIKDNLWSTLLVAIIVAWFIQCTNMNPQPSHYDSRAAERITFIKQQGELISQRYGFILQNVSEKHKVNPIIMEALLVYENINRPLFARRVENILVGFLPFPLTVGVAQVSSRKKLSDEESIEIMGKILGKKIVSLHDSIETFDWLLQLLEVYNGKKYAQNVIDILTVLHPCWYTEVKTWKPNTSNPIEN
jgi:hypothetical protein